MRSKSDVNTTFSHVYRNLLKIKDQICRSFTLMGNARKCHICLKFAVVSKNIDQNVHFPCAGWLANVLPKPN